VGSSHTLVDLGVVCIATVRCIFTKATPGQTQSAQDGYTGFDAESDRHKHSTIFEKSFAAIYRLAKNTAKELNRLFQRRDESVDFFASVVKIEAGTGCRLGIDAAVQRLGAVMSGTNGNA